MNEPKKLPKIYLTSFCSRMAQLSNFQRDLIVLFKKEHLNCGLKKCQQILPESLV